VKYVHGTDFSQLTLAEGTEIKDLGHATPDLVISQSSSSRIQTYVRKFNPDIYAEQQKSNGCAKTNALLGQFKI
jgi:hypothetical protein